MPADLDREQINVVGIKCVIYDESIYSGQIYNRQEPYFCAIRATDWGSNLCTTAQRPLRCFDKLIDCSRVALQQMMELQFKAMRSDNRAHAGSLLTMTTSNGFLRKLQKSPAFALLGVARTAIAD